MLRTEIKDRQGVDSPARSLLYFRMNVQYSKEEPKWIARS